jgi:hypothetical protein
LAGRRARPSARSSRQTDRGAFALQLIAAAQPGMPMAGSAS